MAPAFFAILCALSAIGLIAIVAFDEIAAVKRRRRGTRRISVH
jgi:hypothetical protein